MPTRNWKYNIYGNLLTLLCCLILLCASALAQDPDKKDPTISASVGSAEKVNSAPIQTVSSTGEYLLQRGDQLDIRVYDFPALTEALKIRPDGKISLVLLGDLQAAGLTASQLSARITDAYSEHFRNPRATVIVKAFVNQMVFVGGEVDKPGLLPLDGDLTAAAAIFWAGGAKRSAKLSQVVLLRDSGMGTPTTMMLNLKQILEHGKPDVPLKPFDVVFVPKTKITKVDDFVEQYFRNTTPVPLNVGFSYLLNAAAILR